MLTKLVIKNTFLFLVLFTFSCGNSIQKSKSIDNIIGKGKITDKKTESSLSINVAKIKTGADNFQMFGPLLKDKKVGIVTNQSGIITITEAYSTEITHGKATKEINYHIVDYLLLQKVAIQKIFAPEHGFRGTADAGEVIKDGKDTKTGLPIISLYGNNKKPKADQLKDIDVLLFDLQDVGARFYTYISTLHYIMEACAENNIQLIVLDRPNPNGGIIDGPILESGYHSFVGMHEIPLLHGMTIGEYARMINGQNWLANKAQCKLTVIPCTNYNRNLPYDLPVKPSPNLPNAQAINLYASLCLFEGTNVSVGRGTENQFQIYGSPLLPKSNFSFIPKPNEGAKDPLYNGKLCYGEDLTNIEKVAQLELKWLLKAYNTTTDKAKFFNSFFTKLAGTKKLQEQIEAGISEKEIRASWKKGIEEFKIMRKPYLIYE